MQAVQNLWPTKKKKKKLSQNFVFDKQVLKSNEYQ